MRSKPLETPDFRSYSPMQIRAEIKRCKEITAQKSTATEKQKEQAMYNLAAIRQYLTRMI